MPKLPMPLGRLAPVASILLTACAAETAAPEPLPITPGVEVQVLEPIVLTERARLPENDPAFVGVTVEPERLVFELDGPLATEIAAGDVIVGGRGPGYLRTALTVTQLDDAHLEITTAPAALTDFMQEGHFIVRYRAPEEAAATSDALVAGRRERLGNPQILIPADPFDLKCGGGSDAGATAHPSLSLDPTFELEVDVDVDWHWYGPEPELALFHLVLGGSVDAGIAIDGTGAWDASCTIDVADAVGLPTVELPALTFTIPAGPIPIPVRIDHSVAPVFSLTVAEHVEPEALSYRAAAGIGLRMGVHYEDGDWSPVWEPTPYADGWFTSGGPGAFSISDRVSLGLEYQTRIYGVAGPNMALTGFIEAAAGTGADLCSWEGTVTTGVEASLSGTLEIDEGPVDWGLEVDIGSVDLVSSPLFMTAGTFPWCGECAGPTVCTDDLGREVCEGDRGIMACDGGTMACRCGGDGAFGECGACVPD